ncbi:MAG: glycoside hydrolase family 36 protein [Lentisphaeria bacterium]
MEVSIFKNNSIFQKIKNTDALFEIPILPKEDCNITIEFCLPLLNFHRYWSPELTTPSNKLPWDLKISSATQIDFPYFTFFDSDQKNSASVSLIGAVDDNCFHVKMNQEQCTYDIVIKVASSGSPFTFRLDQRKIDWQECLASWRNSMQKLYPQRIIPQDAWNPVFCTWYMAHAAITQKKVEETAEKAIKLGFKTMIIDDGWCFDEMKRVSPETIQTWYERIGDWQVSSKKFPDFNAHVKRIQALGMKYLLWVAPFLIGDHSSVYPKLKESLINGYHEGCYTLNPMDPKATKIIADKLLELLKNHPIDGLKIDFLDYVLPDIDHPHSTQMMKFIQNLTDAIRKHNMNSLIEFRQRYATMQMLPYATQFRAGDVPFDFVENFQRICQIRLSIGDQVPVHADPIYWHPDESIDNIARHLIASLAGVPMLSIDLENMRPDVKEVLKNHIDLYYKYQQTLNHGKWQIRYNNSAVAYAAASGADENVLFINDSAYYPEALKNYASAKSLLVFNLSGQALQSFSGTCYQPSGKEEPLKSIPPAGHGVILA